VIGLAGGVFLIMMSIQTILKALASAPVAEVAPATGAGANHGFTTGLSFGLGKPILAGIILTASNPYFLVWWATVGLALATQAAGWGMWAFALFALTHWSVDLIWLQILSWASSKGSVFFGPHFQRIVLLICALALLGFGLFFIFSAIRAL
jgi:threonine/homoserine/homoserine lactone efflux protein